MICIAISGQRMSELNRNLKAAVVLADIVEIRADGVRDFSLSRLPSSLKCPVIFTCRSKTQGGRFNGSESMRLNLIQQAIDSNRFDYVDVDIGDRIRRPQSHTKIILSHHNFHNTPNNLVAVYRRLAAKGPDAVKIVTYARGIEDNLKIFRLTGYASGRIPLIVFCMGQAGLISRVLYKKFGFFLTYAALDGALEPVRDGAPAKSGRQTVTGSYPDSHRGKGTAPGQIPFSELKYMYCADQLNKNTAVYGLLGYPLGHSVSPLLFNYRFREKRMNAVYLPFATERLVALPQIIRKLNIRGLSVTIPHKTAIIRYLDKLEPEAKTIGAVNTAYKRAKQLIGANTDYYGIRQSLKDIPCSCGINALVLGAGGAARAVVYALRQSGIPVTVASRNRRQGRQLAARFGCEYLHWSDLNRRNLERISLLVNATPVGMFPDINKSPLKASLLNKWMTIFDTVYNPSETRLLKDARRRGCRTVSGLEMFIHQADSQFRYFVR
ncbi:MAG: shikimate dehydrogenase [Planctomycetes bacterium]|nr:shikimate dehydrogenase [Planctomycetota bacterium]